MSQRARDQLALKQLDHVMARYDLAHLDDQLMRATGHVPAAMADPLVSAAAVLTVVAKILAERRPADPNPQPGG